MSKFRFIAKHMFEKLEIFLCDDDNTPQPVEPSVACLGRMMRTFE